MQQPDAPTIKEGGVLVTDSRTSFGVRSVATTDYSITSNLSLYKPTPGAATNWGQMFNDNSDMLDVEVQALKDIAHVAATMNASALDYLTLDVSTQTFTLAQIDLTTDVGGLLPYTQISGVPTNLGQFTNGPGYITASNNLS
ncbi:MAG: hypothetical protein VW829_14290, partial [Deltaproteobacteria bacterium]